MIFNAVDLDAWAGGRADSTLRAELGLDEDRFVMLCASRFAEDKGHKYLIDSVKRLTERTDRPFTLVLAGDGPLLEPTKAQVAELGLEDCVKFIGFRKDMKNLYKGSDLYVNSSQHEALSFLIIEAMAAGLPVIATDMGATPTSSTTGRVRPSGGVRQPGLHGRGHEALLGGAGVPGPLPGERPQNHRGQV